MNKLRGYITTITVMAAIPLVAFAQITNPIGANSLTELLLRIIEIIILIATPVVVIAVIYAGFLFVTAGGNEAKITLAKKMLFWTLIGALILLGSRVIAATVQGTVNSLAP